MFLQSLFFLSQQPQQDLEPALCDQFADAGFIDHKLRGLPNALLTPHIAWATNEALQRLMDITANNLRTWLDGAGENIVNA